MKKDNLVFKFREFNNNLSEKERKDLWDILTALRGNDKNHAIEGAEKCLTTARIRGELFNKKGFSHGIAGYSYPSYSVTPKYAKQQVEKVKKESKDFSSHFYAHIRTAILALSEYRPKKAMRDLQKFLNY